MINIALWAAGAVLVILAVWRIRTPYARLAELERIADNARRYESWRGNRSSDDDALTGASVMRQLMRRQLVMWTIVGAIGVAVVFAGFAIR